MRLLTVIKKKLFLYMVSTWKFMSRLACFVGCLFIDVIKLAIPIMSECKPLAYAVDLMLPLSSGANKQELPPPITVNSKGHVKGQRMSNCYCCYKENFPAHLPASNNPNLSCLTIHIKNRGLACRHLQIHT